MTSLSASPSLVLQDLYDGLGYNPFNRRMLHVYYWFLSWNATWLPVQSRQKHHGVDECTAIIFCRLFNGWVRWLFQVPHHGRWNSDCFTKRHPEFISVRICSAWTCGLSWDGLSGVRRYLACSIESNQWNVPVAEWFGAVLSEYFHWLITTIYGSPRFIFSGWTDVRGILYRQWPVFRLEH